MPKSAPTASTAPAKGAAAAKRTVPAKGTASGKDTMPAKGTASTKDTVPAKGTASGKDTVPAKGTASGKDTVSAKDTKAAKAAKAAAKPEPIAEPEPIARPEAGAKPTTSSPNGYNRLAVRKTYKLYVGGAFPRSESGRTYLVDGDNVALASRKDARDAVVAARKAQPKWAGATAYNRGQVVYRIAEMVEARRAEFVALGVPAAEVDAAVDRLIWYAGWADKIAQVTGNANPVAGPYFNLSAPEPTGVVGVVAPASLLGLVSVVAPTIVTGNTVVVLAAGPQVAITLAEALATSDVPGGVVNILTGRPAETAPWLASHDDVNALDLTGLDDPSLAADLERAAAGTLKRVLRPPAGAADLTADPGLGPITAFLETKTVWHPKGF